MVSKLHGGRESVLARRPRLGDSRRICVQHAPHVLEVAERGRDHQIVGGPSQDQQAGRFDVAVNAPERAVPERQVDRLKIDGRITAVGTRAVAVKGMNVRAPIQQEGNDLTLRRRDRAVQRRAPRPIAQVNEPRIGVEECANLIDVTGGCRNVDRVIGVGRPRPAATRTNILQ